MCYFSSTMGVRVCVYECVFLKCKKLKQKVIDETKRAQDKINGKKPSYYKAKIKNNKMSNKMLMDIDCSELKDKLEHLKRALSAREAVSKYIEEAKTDKSKKCFGSKDKHKNDTAEKELITSKETVEKLQELKGCL